MSSTVSDLDRYKELQKNLESLHKEIGELRLKLAKDCNHPEEFVYTTTRDYDNGYGRWWKRDNLVCKICWAENHFGNWISRERLVND